MTDTLPDDPRDLQLSREVGAPRDLVWAALTEPVHLARWWGPSGFRTEIHTHDMRPGGAWRFTMYGPDGRAYLNNAVFDEVSAPSRLVLRYVEETGDAVHHNTTITLDELGPTRTRITLHLRFPTVERKEAAVRFGAVEGGGQTLARLAALLETGPSAREDDGAFVLRRVLAAPQALVWAAWTDATHLARWFHPDVWTITRSELDLRAGGAFFYAFSGPSFPEAHGVWRFTEVDAPRRLGFELSFADAAGNLAPSPFGGPWPARIATTVTLERHAGIGGGTLLTLRQTPVHATDEEVAAFRAMIPSMEGGWGQTIDSLVAFLAQAS